MLRLGLSPVAQSLLTHISHTTRNIAGTQETRIMMIFAIQAYRIRYGTPIVVTVSLDDSYTLLMIRLSRTRRNDPVMTHKITKPLSHSFASEMHDLNASSDDIVLVACVEDMEHFVIP